MTCARASAALVAVILFGTVPAARLAAAQDYPSRTIKILVSTAPGGLLDILPRILGQKITEMTGQPVVVENGWRQRAIAGEAVRSRRPTATR